MPDYRELLAELRYELNDALELKIEHDMLLASDDGGQFFHEIIDITEDDVAKIEGVFAGVKLVTLALDGILRRKHDRRP